MGRHAHYEDVLADIRARDDRDSHRAAAPLLQAEDAVLIDTSDMDAEEAIAAALAAVEERRG
jgi:cytidylate kinase